MPRNLARAAVLAFALTLGLAGAGAAADDGFAAFWTRFAAALRVDNQPALAGMVQMGDGLDQLDKTFAQFHAHALGPKVRACLAKAKPEHALDGYGKPYYQTYCGQLIYVFYPTAGGWKLTDVGPDD